MERFVHASLFAVIFAAAWTYGSAKREHRVIALLFGWALLANVTRLALDPVLDAAGPTYSGPTLFLYYVDHALVLSFHFALLAACAKHFTRASLHLPLLAFALAVGVVVLLKEATSISLLPVHHGIAGLVMAACWLLVMREIFAPASRLQAPDAVHAILLIALAQKVVNVALHYAGPVEDTWIDVRRADLFVDGGIALGYLWVLVRNGALRWKASRS